MSKSGAGGAGGGVGRGARAAPSSAEPDTLPVIRAAESEIWLQPYEEMNVFTTSGDLIFRKAGTKNEVTFTLNQAEKMRGGILTHNHPQGSSLSPTDVELASTMGMAEIRAVAGPYRVFSMRPPPGGWNEQYTLNVLRPAWNRHNEQVRVRVQAGIDNGSIGIMRAMDAHWHTVWLNVSKELGLDYRHTGAPAPL